MGKAASKRGGNRRKTPDPSEVPYPLVNKPKFRGNFSVSSRGTGLVVYLPKDTCEVYDIMSGDVLILTIEEHYRKRRPDED
jgi:hypothetical protein